MGNMNQRAKMGQSNSAWRLRHTLLLIVCLTITAEIVVISYIYHVKKEEFRLFNTKKVENIANAIDNVTVSGRIMGAAQTIGAANKRIRDLLLGAKDLSNSDVESVLDRIKALYRATFVYVMDVNGTVVASTVQNKQSFLGNNYAFRPYFKQAMKGRISVYPAVGVTTYARGIYFSSPIYESENATLSKTPLGVIVVKADLSSIDNILSREQGPAALVSPQGIVFATNIYSWLFKSIKVFTDIDIAPLRNNRQFGDMFSKSLPLPLPFDLDIDHLVEFDGKEYLPLIVPVSFSDNFGQWKVIYLCETSEMVPVGLIFSSSMSVLFIGFAICFYAVLSIRQKVENINKMILIEQSERNYRSIFEAVNELILIYDPDSKSFVDVNKKAISFFGLKSVKDHEINQLNFGAELSNYSPECFYKYIEMAREDGEQQFEWPAKNVEQRIRWFEVSIKNAEIGAKNQLIIVMVDITERKNMENAIKNINLSLEHRVEQRTRELAAANSELEAFCYSVSHDLRSPLVSIGGYSQVLEHEYIERLGPTGLNYIQRIRKAGKRMEHIIEDLLSLSRLSREEFKKESIDLSKLAKETVSLLKDNYPKKIVELKIDGSMIINADESMIRVALENLIGNSFKFTEKEPIAIIEIGQKIIGNEKVFFVKDNGAGFDMSYADKLFIPFERYHSQKEFEGSGIGLATVKRIITRHSGRIWAEGKVGEGATFYFTIPDIY